MNYLKRKLFYSGWIRYLIASNLIMAHNCIFFLYIKASFSDLGLSISSSIRILLIVIIVFWTFFTTIFLHKNKNMLEDKTFKRKFSSMFNGIKTKRITSYMYSSVFCFRRLLLVCTLLALKEEQYWLICAFNGSQTFYLWYITSCKPHQDAIYNRLEIFNESCIIIL